MPPWLQMHCYEDPDSDPGHDTDYDDDRFDYDAVDERCYSLIDFIAKLQPFKSAEPVGDQSPVREAVYIREGTVKRMPPLCPLGLRRRP
jgi:hypothetical protein